MKGPSKKIHRAPNSGPIAITFLHATKINIAIGCLLEPYFQPNYISSAVKTKPNTTTVFGRCQSIGRGQVPLQQLPGSPGNIIFTRVARDVDFRQGRPGRYFSLISPEIFLHPSTALGISGVMSWHIHDTHMTHTSGNTAQFCCLPSKMLGTYTLPFSVSYRLWVRAGR